MLLTVIHTGVTFYFYSDAKCKTKSSLSSYILDTCYEPWQEFPAMTTDIDSLMESTYRTLSCGKDDKSDDDDDDDEYGGLGLGGFIGVVAGGSVIVILAVGTLIQMNKKPSDDSQSLLKNEQY